MEYDDIIKAIIEQYNQPPQQMQVDEMQPAPEGTMIHRTPPPKSSGGGGGGGGSGIWDIIGGIIGGLL